MRSWRIWALRLVPAALLLGLIGALFLPRPVPVDVGTATRGPFTVTVEEEGETRVREVYLVSAPISGRVLRIEGEVGDAVAAGETVLARILPTTPGFLDRRTRAERLAAIETAEAALTLARAEVARAEAELDYARAELSRRQPLFDRGHVAEAVLDEARRAVRTQEAALAESEAAVSMRSFELETARAALIDPSAEETPASTGNPDDAPCCLDLHAPVDGRILRVHHESEATVLAGQPLVELGDPSDLEVVVDLLSQDAVRVSPGDTVEILRWGGDGALAGEVERVEPFGITKVSSLGIEEQRVDVVIRLTDPRNRWARLGHGYRVDARIVLRDEPDALKVPSSALFRAGGTWQVFRVIDGRARSTPVEIGADTGLEAEIVAGLEPGDRVILYPGERVVDGVRVTAR